MAFAFQPAARVKPGLFGMGPFAGTPPIADMPPGAAQEPAQPFVWGQGGTALPMDQIAAMRDRAQAEMAMGADFSPVGHWTQGLARAMHGVTGALQMRKADKAAAASQAESDAVTKALLANPDKQTVLSAMANPNLSKGAGAVAGLLAEQMFAKPPAPTEFERAMTAAGIMPGTPEFADMNRRYLTSKVDPFTVIQANGGTYAGAQSLVEAAMKGGGQTSGVPQTTAPPAEAIAELKADPSGAAEFDQVFGAGAAARILGNGGPAAAPGTFPLVR